MLHGRPRKENTGRTCRPESQKEMISTAAHIPEVSATLIIDNQR